MVSIIILSYNTKALLHECLKSIYSSLGSFSFEVIVLDNASSDESVSMVRSLFPDVTVIESEVNLGFGKGINQAAKKAKGDFLLFLNSDAMLLDDHLKEMVRKIEEDDSIGIVGGNLLERNNATSEAFGSFYHLPEVIRLLFFRRKSRPTVSETFSSVDWVSGGYMLIKKDVFNKLSGFDEKFFMYIEDMDLCYRVRQGGKSVYYFKSAKAKHVGQGSSNRTFAIINIYKGLLYFYRKHKPKWEYFVVQFLLVVKAVGAVTLGFLTGNQFLKKTYVDALKAVI